MKSWTTWTATCFILCSIGFMPLHTSAVDSVEGTSLTQAQVKATNTAAPPAPELTSKSSSFVTTISNWQAALAKEKGFEDWQHAAWKSYPLGPGTHGWVIILTNQEQEVGYMIVNATDAGGYRLTEYGTGTSPLFSLATLYRSLVQQELIPSSTAYTDFVQNETIVKDRLYMDSLTSVWKIKLEDATYYLDAKSGEVLPLKEDPAPRLKDELVSASDLSQGAQTFLRPAFDPYERLPWIEGTPLPVTSLPELEVALQQQGTLTYVTELYDEQVTMPLAVLGYQQWVHGDTYLALDHEGPRYVLLDTSLGLGKLYP
ncbi:hypothetical protein A8709_30255 [Paenibacillus pectinilyticus]|uniref:PepSY domain-containing protein n=1 Tax=Paenibacillus pectinilyticus TaxID=512399 RepID=A0A1C0ZVN4_9BACL|nr:hypothetical protein [Paenibacillus pectinilyticus]OCT12137.1 hypothetical protein A8709_30255 [Paenibacillus pectinilyticus]